MQNNVITLVEVERKPRFNISPNKPRYFSFFLFAFFVLRHNDCYAAHKPTYSGRTPLAALFHTLPLHLYLHIYYKIYCKKTSRMHTTCTKSSFLKPFRIFKNHTPAA